MSREKITIESTVNKPVSKVWQCWTDPNHVIQWNNASEDWHTTRAQNDLRPGGRFSFRMEAKDGSFGFDYDGIYDEVEPNKSLRFTMSDGRTVNVRFSENNSKTHISETFEAEETNSIEMQRNGWQSILDNFKRYTENL